jgi:hypothetical protein
MLFSVNLFDWLVSRLLATNEFKIRGVWRSVNKPAFSAGLEAAKPTNIYFSPN